MPLTRQRRPTQLVPRTTDRRLKTSWFQPTPETLKEQDAILSQMYFLVRQGDAFGERLKCRECGARHNYITLRCVEKPITGLANGLYAYYRAIKDANLEKHLSPQNRTRFEEIQVALMNIPDLGSVHPMMARKLVTDIGPSDMQLGALSLGILEGISPTQARLLVEKINERGIKPPYTLDVPTQAEIDRSLEYRGTPTFTRSRW